MKCAFIFPWLRTEIQDMYHRITDVYDKVPVYMKRINEYIGCTPEFNKMEYIDAHRELCIYILGYLYYKYYLMLTNQEPEYVLGYGFGAYAALFAKDDEYFFKGLEFVNAIETMFRNRMEGQSEFGILELKDMALMSNQVTRLCQEITTEEREIYLAVTINCNHVILGYRGDYSSEELVVHFKGTIKKERNVIPMHTPILNSLFFDYRIIASHIELCFDSPFVLWPSIVRPLVRFNTTNILLMHLTKQIDWLSNIRYLLNQKIDTFIEVTLNSDVSLIVDLNKQVLYSLFDEEVPDLLIKTKQSIREDYVERAKRAICIITSTRFTRKKSFSEEELKVLYQTKELIRTGSIDERDAIRIEDLCHMIQKESSIE